MSIDVKKLVERVTVSAGSDEFYALLSGDGTRCAANDGAGAFYTYKSISGFEAKYSKVGLFKLKARSPSGIYAYMVVVKPGNADGYINAAYIGKYEALAAAQKLPYSVFIRIDPYGMVSILESRKATVESLVAEALAGQLIYPQR